MMRRLRRLTCLLFGHQWVPFRVRERSNLGTLARWGTQCSRCKWCTCRVVWTPRTAYGRLVGMHLIEQWEAKAIAGGATVRRYS